MGHAKEARVSREGARSPSGPPLGWPARMGRCGYHGWALSRPSGSSYGLGGGYGAALAVATRMCTGRLAAANHAYPTWSYGVRLAAGQFFVTVGWRTARAAGTSAAAAPAAAASDPPPPPRRPRVPAGVLASTPRPGRKEAQGERAGSARSRAPADRRPRSGETGAAETPS